VKVQVKYRVSSIVGELNCDKMAGKKLQSRSVSEGRDIEEANSETAHEQAESNPTQENELGRGIGEVNGVDRQRNSHSESSNNEISANQLQEFMRNVRGLSGKYRAVFNILRTSSMTLM
jgi:hypothetical protein